MVTAIMEGTWAVFTKAGTDWDFVTNFTSCPSPPKETKEGKRLLFSLIQHGLRKPLMNKPHNLIDELFPELRTAY